MEWIGPYRVEERIGAGGMGVVLGATAPNGQPVAIKLLRPVADARFERELQAQRQLGSEAGCVPLLDAGVCPAGPYLVMPLLTGGDLARRLRHGPLPLAAGIELARSLARALAAVHALGMVHRDLKPENVLFDGGGRPLLSDLGLAKHYTGPEAALSRTGELRGTAGYLPPEQFRDAKRVGPASDVFAWGAVLYEALSGRPAFDAVSPLQRVVQAENGEVAPLRSLRPEVPEWLAAVIHRALAPRVADRYPDGEALHVALRAGAASGESSAVAARGVGVRRRTPWAAVGGALLLAVVVAGGALLAWRRREPPPSSADSAALDRPSAPGPGEEGDGAPAPPSPSPPSPSPSPSASTSASARPSPSDQGPASAHSPPEVADQEPAPTQEELDAALARIQAEELERLRGRMRASPFEVAELWGDPRGKHGCISLVGLGWLRGDREALSVGNDGTVVRWDARHGQDLGRQRLPQALRGDAQVFPGGEVVYPATEQLVCFDSRAGSVRWTLLAPGLVDFAADLEADMAVLALPREIVLCELPSGKVRWRWRPRVAVSPQVAMVPGRGQVLVAAQGLHLLDLASGQGRALSEDLGAPNGSVVSASPDGRLAVTARRGGRGIRWWDLERGGLAGAAQLGELGLGVFAMAWSRDGARLYLGTHEGKLLELPARTSAPGRIIAGRPSRITCVAPGPGERLLVGGWSRLVRAWDGERVRWPAAANGATRWIAASPDGQRVISSGWDLVVWDRASQRWPRHVAHGAGLDRLHLPPSGDLAVSQGRHLYWWDLQRGGTLGEVQGLDAATSVVTFRGPRELLGARYDPQGKTCALLRIELGKEPQVVARLSSMVLDLAPLQEGPEQQQRVALLTPQVLGHYVLGPERVERQVAVQPRAQRDGRSYTINGGSLDPDRAGAILSYASADGHRLLAHVRLDGSPPQQVAFAPTPRPGSLLTATRWGAAWIEDGNLLLWADWERGPGGPLTLPLEVGHVETARTAHDGESLYLGTARGLILTLRRR
ncbi:MAG: protein kinase [Planctomycetota bacterium]